jgi:two-component system CheB/CheR fusion protein
MPRRPNPAAASSAGGALVAVIGLGASAGGLEALTDFLRAFPAGHGVALIVVQHMAREQVSALAVLLQRHTALPVLQATADSAIEPEAVYVIQPGTELTVSSGRLHVTHCGPGAASAHQIDTLFKSMAGALGPHAAGVVLSGMGSDGTEGLRAIIDQGGVGAAQAPESALFDSMPRSAAAIGRGVLVGIPCELPLRVLLALPQQSAGLVAAPDPVPRAPASPPSATPDDASAMQAVLRLLEQTTGHDFSQYKPSTLQRRIERRMALHAMPSMAAYARLLAASGQEGELLFQELLIGVTGFFRDPPLWQALAATVLPQIVAQAAARPEPGLRAWVVGCSTGEEAYTLAMLLCEAVADAALPQALKVQIFATDLSGDAIQTARRGLYPDSLVQGVSASRLSRFFVRETGGYRVAKALRDMVLFARHNVIGDPPFMRLDIVSCRNLLIYFKPTLQHKLVPLFHYVLRPGGALLLGNSETVGRFESLFAPLDTRLRLYRRCVSAAARSLTVFPVKPSALSPPHAKDVIVPASPDPHPLQPLQAMTDRLMLEEFAPPAALVNEQGDILYRSGRTEQYLEPAAGKANWNIHAMAREGLRAALATALQQVRQGQRAIELRGIKVPTGAGVFGVDLSVRPVHWAGSAGMALVIFRDAADTSLAPRTQAARTRRTARQLQLQQALEDVQSLREEMSSSQEELQSANEELQSANEELTTSREEMQALNQEQQAVNAELVSKLNDLALAQSDLKNLLNSTQIATLFLDGAMNVRRFTEQAKRVISLRDGDIGRPLTDLTTALDYPSLPDDIAGVLQTLEFRETAIRATDGRWFSVRIMPYRTHDNVIDGSVITFVDITVAKELEARLREANGRPQLPG